MPRRCQRCDGESSRAARFCQWCGLQLRDLESFESPNVPNHALVPFAELREELRPGPTEYKSRSVWWPTELQGSGGDLDR